MQMHLVESCPLLTYFVQRLTTEIWCRTFLPIVRLFEFVCLLNKELHPRDVYPLGYYVAVNASVRFLTEHFPHLTKNQISIE